MAAKRPEVDWVGVQASYRSGQLPNEEIARRYSVTEGAIRYRAKREGWQQDLTHDYKAGVRSAVLRESYERIHGPRKKKAADERAKDVLAVAINEGKQVVLRHQLLGNILAGNSQTIAEVIKEQIAEVRASLAEDPPDDLEPKEEFARVVALTKRLAMLAKAHDSLARASVNAVAIERQARGLDEMPADPNAPPSISITYYRSDLVLNNNQSGAGRPAVPAIEIKSGKVS